MFVNEIMTLFLLKEGVDNRAELVVIDLVILQEQGVYHWLIDFIDASN